MNWKTFYAMLQRDGHVARRNLLPMLAQNLLQPLLFTFVFGRVMTTSGMIGTIVEMDDEIAFSELNAGSTIPASIFAMRDWLTPASRASLACVIPS